MTDIPPLHTLGRRIMVLGLTNSGKSTLAAALSAKLAIPAVHLDQLNHMPHTEWVERPKADFVALHDAAIEQPEWVIDGGYSRVMPQRIARASGIIVLTDGLAIRYWRYIRRCLFETNRAGGLEGASDRMNLKMLGWLWKTRNAVGKYHAVAGASGLPHVFAGNASELNALYDAWGLKRPGA